MRILIVLVLLAGLTAPLHAAPGRGEFAAWSALAGAWEGPGQDAGGEMLVTAALEPLFDGRFLLVRTTERRAATVVREQLAVWAAGESPATYLYDAKAPFRKLASTVETSDTALTAGDATLKLAWRQTADGLAGSREENGATTASWTLRRVAARPVTAKHERRRSSVVGPVNDLVGQLVGEGLTAVVPGQGASELFKAEESGAVTLSGAIVVSRVTHKYDARTESALLIHAVEDDKPFRHAFLARGEVELLDGEFIGVDQMKFTGPRPGGDVVITFVHT